RRRICGCSIRLQPQRLGRSHLRDRVDERVQPVGYRVSHGARCCGASMSEGARGMAWLFLCVAGVLEIAFAFGVKWSQGFARLMPRMFTIVMGVASVFLLSRALRTLPMGTGYAVWTGIGAAGTAVLGVLFMGESAALIRILCIALIFAGVIGLKFVSAN